MRDQVREVQVVGLPRLDLLMRTRRLDRALGGDGAVRHDVPQLALRLL